MRRHGIKEKRLNVAPLIAVVDDDLSVRKSLNRLLKSASLDVNIFASAEDFLNADEPRKADCLVLDVRLPGMSGIELHRHLLANNFNVPVIFITAHGSDEDARRLAASDWTFGYLIKPFNADELLDAIDVALKRQAGA